MTTIQTMRDIAKVGSALGMLESVIKCGESWSSECEHSLIEAFEALTRITQKQDPNFRQPTKGDRPMTNAAEDRKEREHKAEQLMLLTLECLQDFLEGKASFEVTATPGAMDSGEYETRTIRFKRDDK